MKKIGLFGCKTTTIFLLESLKEVVDISCVITISPEVGLKNEVADYTDITKYCKKNEIDVYEASRYDLKSSEDIALFERLNLDIAFVIGWQRLIPKEILNTFSVGVFGMHGSTDDLPLGRGRSPMNWALIERRKHFFTNLFRYDPGVDSGDILDTFAFSIQCNDTAETMHYKNVLAMKTLIAKNIKNLISDNFSLHKQNDTKPTYYPKRSPKDSLINWRQDIFSIDSFIRAVTSPFNGAFSYINNEKVIIWRAAIFETDIVDYGYCNHAWGTVVEVFPSGKFLIKCRGGLLLVHTFDANIEIRKNEVFHSQEEDLKTFILNDVGFHDLIGD